MAAKFSVNSALVWNNGKAFFFRGHGYFRFDIANDRVDPGYPKMIRTGWHGFPTTFEAGIDAAIVWPNGKAFFFKGNKYCRFDIANDRVDPGYPKSTVDNWSGLGYVYISSPEAQFRINEALKGKTTSNFALHMADDLYYCHPLKEAREIIANNTINTNTWTAEKYDCDDFAFALKTEFIRTAYVDNVRYAAACFGILWGTGLRMNGTGTEPVHHAINWMINDDLKLRFVEPQNDRVYFPGSYDTGIYFMVT